MRRAHHEFASIEISRDNHLWCTKDSHVFRIFYIICLVHACVLNAVPAMLLLLQCCCCCCSAAAAMLLLLLQCCCCNGAAAAMLQLLQCCNIRHTSYISQPFWQQLINSNLWIAALFRGTSWKAVFERRGARHIRKTSWPHILKSPSRWLCDCKWFVFHNSGFWHLVRVRHKKKYSVCVWCMCMHVFIFNQSTLLVCVIHVHLNHDNGGFLWSPHQLHTTSQCNIVHRWFQSSGGSQPENGNPNTKPNT